MQSTQVQLKISLSEQLNDLLTSKAQLLGVPVTQFVKHLILEEVKDTVYPTFQMSERTAKKAQKAMKDYKEGKAIEAGDLHEFFKNL
jgi:hypothetical protein